MHISMLEVDYTVSDVDGAVEVRGVPFNYAIADFRNRQVHVSSGEDDLIIYGIFEEFTIKIADSWKCKDGKEILVPGKRIFSCKAPNGFYGQTLASKIQSAFKRALRKPEKGNAQDYAESRFEAFQQDLKLPGLLREYFDYEAFKDLLGQSM